MRRLTSVHGWLVAALCATVGLVSHVETALGQSGTVPELRPATRDYGPPQSRLPRAEMGPATHDFGPPSGGFLDLFGLPEWFGWSGNALGEAADVPRHVATIMRRNTLGELFAYQTRLMADYLNRLAVEKVHGGKPGRFGVFDVAGNVGSVVDAAAGGDGAGVLQEGAQWWISGRFAAWGGLHGSRLGVSLGTPFGPLGMCVGGVVGGVGGAFATSLLEDYTWKPWINDLANASGSLSRWFQGCGDAREILARLRLMVASAKSGLEAGRIDEADDLAVQVTNATGRMQSMMENLGSHYTNALSSVHAEAISVRGEVAKIRLAVRYAEAALTRARACLPRNAYREGITLVERALESRDLLTLAGKQNLILELDGLRIRFLASELLAAISRDIEQAAGRFSKQDLAGAEQLAQQACRSLVANADVFASCDLTSDANALLRRAQQLLEQIRLARQSPPRPVTPAREPWEGEWVPTTAYRLGNMTLTISQSSSGSVSGAFVNSSTSEPRSVYVIGKYDRAPQANSFVRAQHTPFNGGGDRSIASTDALTVNNSLLYDSAKDRFTLTSQVLHQRLSASGQPSTIVSYQMVVELRRK